MRLLLIRFRSNEVPTAQWSVRAVWKTGRQNAKAVNRRVPPLFPDDLDQDSIGEFALEQVHHAVFHKAFEDLALGLSGATPESRLEPDPADPPAC